MYQTIIDYRFITITHRYYLFSQNTEVLFIVKCFSELLRPQFLVKKIANHEFTKYLNISQTGKPIIGTTIIPWEN